MIDVSVMNKRQQIALLCKHVWEMNRQAPHDFGGEQREFYIPKLQELMVLCGVLFTDQMATAMEVDVCP